ncbi:MAG TPA: DUF5330 domain-containing protein [Methyloceanibacter sp.]|nr:DUF5330 domain-containing protein [Methyloceanibacter sp.]
MFLIRTAFWLAIIILLLPTDSKQQGEVYGTAQAAVKDVTGFCDRNPDACAKGMDVFQVFVQKAEFGFEMLMGFVENKDATATSVPDVPAASIAESAEPTSFSPEQTQDTLEPQDLQPAWNGPSGT